MNAACSTLSYDRDHPTKTDTTYFNLHLLICQQLIQEYYLSIFTVASNFSCHKVESTILNCIPHALFSQAGLLFTLYLDVLNNFPACYYVYCFTIFSLRKSMLIKKKVHWSLNSIFRNLKELNIKYPLKLCCFPLLLDFSLLVLGHTDLVSQYIVNSMNRSVKMEAEALKYF